MGQNSPIRFDLLDTIHGQNLSLQVHPTTSYIAREFGLPYTQDESYYILDTQGEESSVYLGLKTGVTKERLEAALRNAQEKGTFDAESYVNQFPVKKHDHVLIPAGTVHCSGKGTMVLEISATPYIFTFKMWDWGRVGWDGRPRPIHIERALDNIQWERDTQWVKDNLLHQEWVAAQGEGWKEEHKDEQVRLAAIGALGKVSKDDGFNALITLIADDAPKTRAASAKALGELGNEHAVAHLVYRLEHETDPEVVKSMKGAITALHEIKE